MVTGGSRGIGAAIVRRLARHGAEVAFRHASPAAQADTVSRSRNWADGRCLSKQIAPRCPNCERREAVDVAARTFGGLDIL
jgi:3-oxoacyl-[acyl-carrier protein] reductase